MPVYQASVLFLRDLTNNPLWVSSWLNILMLVNLASVFFWPLLVAQLIFYALLARALLLLLDYFIVGAKGLLKLGQLLWCTLTVYLVVVLMTNEPSMAGPFKLYVSGLIVCNSLSLILELSFGNMVFETAKRQTN